MAYIKYSPEESSKRARAIYDSVREQVEATETVGKPFIVDVENGVWEIDHEDIQRGREAMQRLQEQHTNTQIHRMRVGWMAFGRRGGAWPRNFVRPAQPGTD